MALYNANGRKLCMEPVADIIIKHLEKLYNPDYYILESPTLTRITIGKLDDLILHLVDQINSAHQIILRSQSNAICKDIDSDYWTRIEIASLIKSTFLKYDGYMTISCHYGGITYDHYSLYLPTKIDDQGITIPISENV